MYSQNQKQNDNTATTKTRQSIHGNSNCDSKMTQSFKGATDVRHSCIFIFIFSFLIPTIIIWERGKKNYRKQNCWPKHMMPNLQGVEELYR